MAQIHIIRGLFMLAIALFFGYRYFSLNTYAHLVGVIIFTMLGMLSLIKRLPTQWQNWAINIGITWFFLDLVFAAIDLKKVAEALLQANYWWFIPAGLLVFVHLIFRAIRWQWLLKPMGEVGFWPAFRAMSIGLAGNILLPARAGEFLRAYVLGRSTGLSKSGAFATLVVERILDGLTVLLFLGITAIFGVNNEIIRTIGVGGFTIYSIALAGLVIFMWKRHWADKLINLILPEHFAQRLLELLDGFSSGLNILKDPKLLTVVSLLSIVTWVFIPLSFWTALLAFDFGVPILWQTPGLMLPIIALGLTLPGAPGGLGMFQYGVKLTMDITIDPTTVAANFAEVVGAASLVVHVVQLVPQLICGFSSFWAEGLSTSDINESRQ